MISDKTKFNEQLIYSIYYISLVGILFLYWLIGKALVIYLVPLGSCFILLLNSRKIEIRMNSIINILLFSLIIIINILITEKHGYIFDSLVKGTILPMFTLVYFNMLKNTEHLKEKILKPSFIILNIYCFINFFIMLKQVNTTGFLVKNRLHNEFYTDLITGFIGDNGTHRLSYLFISTLMLNMYFLKSDNKKYKKAAKIFMIFILISSLYISIFNDNRMYYFILIIYMFPYVISFLKNNLKKIDKQKFLKTIFKSLFIILAVLALYKYNHKFHDIVKNDIIDSYFSRTINDTKKDDSTGEERVNLINYAINNSNPIYGNGIGSIQLLNDSNVPKHFGINDLNIRIYTGGLSYCIIVLYIFFSEYKRIANVKTKGVSIYIILIVLLSAFYTQIFSQIEKTFLIGLTFFLTYCLNNREKIERKEDTNEKNRFSNIS